MAILPKGIHGVQTLPDTKLGALWNSIILEPILKEKLLSQAVLNFVVRPKVERSVLPLHGTILLVGPPGTGKTSLALGLAHRTAESFPKGKFKLVSVDPHALTSSAMGKTQRAVSELFSQSISEAALGGPTIVLLDEVETIFVDRSKTSLEANPVDIHRATDAALVQLDILAQTHHNLLFLATSNFPKAIDVAFLSRCDLILNIPLPNKDACEAILADSLTKLASTYPEIGGLVRSPGFAACVDACVGLDGRAVRKLVVNAMASNLATALDPNSVTIEQLLAAAKALQEVRNVQGNVRR